MRVLRNILNSKTTTFFLCLVLGLIVGGYSFYWREQGVQAGMNSEVIYLLPKDPARMEKNLAQAPLFVGSDLKVDSTSDWNLVRERISKTPVRALVIHYAALENVNQKDLRQWFRQGLVVSGVGIPAKKLADVLGMPSLNVWGDQEIYKTSSYFYVFSLKVEASPKDGQKILAQLKKNGQDVSAEGVQGPASTTGGGSTDSLVTEAGVKRFPSVLKQHIDSVRQP